MNLNFNNIYENGAKISKEIVFKNSFGQALSLGFRR
jgi:hypothetical protein